MGQIVLCYRLIKECDAPIKLQSGFLIVHTHTNRKYYERYILFCYRYEILRRTSSLTCLLVVRRLTWITSIACRKLRTKKSPSTHEIWVLIQFWSLIWVIFSNIIYGMVKSSVNVYLNCYILIVISTFDKIRNNDQLQIPWW